MKSSSSDIESLRTLIDALPSPVWTRDIAGALTFVNPAYARAVEAKDPADALARVGRTARPASRATRPAGARAAGKIYVAPHAGDRRRLAAQFRRARRADPQGQRRHRHRRDRSRGDARASSTASNDAHRRTLDQLATGVAIFTADQRLTFYNAAYRSLWDLDAGFLDQNPTDSAVLDQLRAARKLPEEQDFREWKAALHEAYRATEAAEHVWHLPDGRTMRVVTTPNPQGGVTYLFEDVTERLDMVRRYDALIRVQGETLDNLAEAVAVFGSDGRLRLHNPAFARHVAARAAGARRAPAHRDGDRLVPAALRRRRAVAAAARHRHRDRRPRRSSRAGSSAATAAWSI